MTFDAMWSALEPVGRDTITGGYRRFAWTPEDAALREWFTGEARRRGLEVTTDRAGNLWAWWGNPDAEGPGLVLGSHLDSVPDGGASATGIPTAMLFVRNPTGVSHSPQEHAEPADCHRGVEALARVVAELV